MYLSRPCLSLVILGVNHIRTCPSFVFVVILPDSPPRSAATLPLRLLHVVLIVVLPHQLLHCNLEQLLVAVHSRLTPPWTFSCCDHSLSPSCVFTCSTLLQEPGHGFPPRRLCPREFYQTETLPRLSSMVSISRSRHGFRRGPSHTNTCPWTLLNLVRLVLLCRRRSSTWHYHGSHLTTVVLSLCSAFPRSRHYIVLLLRNRRYHGPSTAHRELPWTLQWRSPRRARPLLSLSWSSSICFHGCLHDIILLVFVDLLPSNTASPPPDLRYHELLAWGHHQQPRVPVVLQANANATTAFFSCIATLLPRCQGSSVTSRNHAYRIWY